MILEMTERAITSIEKDRYPEPLDLLALSLCLGGENMFTLSKEQLKQKISTNLLYNDFRNQLTILSPKENFIIGEIFEGEIITARDTKKIKFIVNIELLALKATSKVPGETPLEIVHNLDKDIFKDIILNTLDVEGIKKLKQPIKTKEELLQEIIDRTTIESSDILIEVDGKIITMYPKGEDIVIHLAYDLNDHNFEIQRQESPDILNILFM